MEILLCVTADDLGYSVERDLGIVSCSIKNGGLVSRTSLLVNGASAVSGFKLARENELPVGLHLNISEGSPCSPLDQVSSLVDDDGFFHGKMKYWSEEETSFAVNLDEVKLEVEAQISRFLEISNGHLPNHWDGHQHVHVLGDIGLAIHSVFSKHMLFRTRMPLYFSSANSYKVLDPLLLPLNSKGEVDNDRERFYKRISDKTFSLRKELGKGHGAQSYYDDLIDASKTFMGYSTMGKDCTEERILAALRECLRVLQMKPTNDKGKVVGAGGANLDLIDIEWMVHPGYKTPVYDREDEKFISAAGCGQGADDFAKSEEREVELKILRQGEKIKAFFKSHNIVLCS